MNFLFVIIPLCSLQIVTSKFCYWNTGCPYKYFSNKTPYNFVRGDIRDSVVKQTGCEPISIWGLVRHGQRYPSLIYANPMLEAMGLIDWIVASYEKGNSSLCAQDVENLKKFQIDQGIFDKPFELTEEGYQESAGLGERIKEAFPKLLANLETNDYLFRPAAGARMVDSAKAFIQGLSDKPLTVEPSTTDFDILSPFESCIKYKSTVRYNPATFKEAEKYALSSEYLALKDRMVRRLGIDYPLTDTNVTALYDLCRFSSSGITGTFSPWCAVFTKEDLKIIEFQYDLKNYYRNSYGTPINQLFGRITLTDLLKSFQEAKSGNGKKITAYISHATVMDMVYTALNLFKDDPPLTASRRNNRKFKSSINALFSANLLVTLNKCNKGADDYNVVFYLNEEPLISICDKGVCTWKEFEKKLSPFLNTRIDDCDIM